MCAYNLSIQIIVNKISKISYYVEDDRIMVNK